MKPEFLRNGKFSHSAVVTEILDRKLSGDDIRGLADDPKMQAEFYGDFTSYKRPPKRWDREYLELLSCVACEECFSLEFLLYLDKVAGHVARAARRKRILYCTVGVLLIIAGILIWKCAGKV